MKMTDSLPKIFAGRIPAGQKVGVGAVVKSVLIVAPSDQSACSMHELLLKGNVANPIDILLGADDLLAYLKRLTQRVRETRVSMPALILLDLSVHHEIAFGLLRWLHGHFSGRDVPIVVLTEKRDVNQLRRAYQLGAWTFLRKPVTSAEFKAMAAALKIPIVHSPAAKAFAR
jgi:CheY-like chemotaxis protein